MIKLVTINKFDKKFKIGRDRFMFSSSFIIFKDSTIYNFTDANIQISHSGTFTKSITSLSKRYIDLRFSYIRLLAGYLIKKKCKNAIKSLVRLLQCCIFPMH